MIQGSNRELKHNKRQHKTNHIQPIWEGFYDTEGIIPGTFNRICLPVMSGNQMLVDYPVFFCVFWGAGRSIFFS